MNIQGEVRRVRLRAPLIATAVAAAGLAGGADGRAYSPAWADQVVYVMIPSRFKDGEPANNFMQREFDLPQEKLEGGFLGGDIAGIRQELPYLKSLGVTALLFYPMFENDSRPLYGGAKSYLATGYRVRNYSTIDRNFGTEAEFRALIDECHDETTGPRLHVLLDLPIAMTGLEHPWHREAGLYPNHYRPWNETEPDENIGATPMTQPYGQVDNNYAMPIVNHTQGMETTSGVYYKLRDDIVFPLVERWDIDGLRYDSAQNMKGDYWPRLMSDFHAKFQRERPHFMQVAEVYIGPKRRKWQLPVHEFLNAQPRSLETSATAAGSRQERIRMDGAYDFALITALQQVFAEGKAAEALQEAHRAAAEVFEHPERLIASVDNYEINSFLSHVRDGNAKARLRCGLTFLLTSNRVPFLYPGNECGVDDERPGVLFGAGRDDGFRAHVSRLISLRRSHPAFRGGTFRWVSVQPPGIAYLRGSSPRPCLILLNPSAKGLDLELVASELPPGAPSAVYDSAGSGPTSTTLRRDDSRLHVTLGPWQCVALEFPSS